MLLVSLVALAIVAFLQYRWTTQVSEVSEARIGSNLQSTMLDWHLDFYREFAAVCVALQVGPDSGAQDGWNAYAQRYSDWTRASGKVDLVKNVYIWETSQNEKARVLRMHPDTSRIEAEPEPSEIQPLLKRLALNSSSLPIAMHAWEYERAPAGLAGDKTKGFARTDTMTGWQFDASIPAIVHPIIHHRDPFENPRFDDIAGLHGAVSNATNAPVDWIVVVLDRDAIEQKIIPSLAQRYFSDKGDLDYELAVETAGSDPHVLYASDPQFARQGTAGADATMNIFGPPPDSTEGHFWQAVKRGESLRSEDWHSFSAPVWFPVIRHVSADQPWTLLVRRRGDPLEALIQRTRRRNLAISAGVFLLLAFSMGLIVVASHRAQKLAQLQMDFVASVSHELRTPLTVICSAAENILDGVVGGKQQLTQYGSVIRNQGRQLASLVDQVLLFASTQDGKMRYQLRPISVPLVLQIVLNNTAALVDRAGGTLVKELAADLPDVMGDASAISQCVQNLIVNAIKYGGEKPWIGIRAGLGDAHGTPEVLISVKDRGIGISSTELPRIFEPFYRSPGVKAAQIHGTGLGLPLAKRIADAMGGRLTVTSRVGFGSIFTLHLLPAPAAKLESQAAVAAKGSSSEP
jgi:signal transduction histidine kinase